MEYNEKRQEPALNSVLDDINNGCGAACYLLYGDEEFKVKDACNRIIDCFLPSRHVVYIRSIVSGSKSLMTIIYTLPNEMPDSPIEKADLPVAHPCRDLYSQGHRT